MEGDERGVDQNEIFSKIHLQNIFIFGHVLVNGIPNTLAKSENDRPISIREISDPLPSFSRIQIAMYGRGCEGMGGGYKDEMMKK